MGVHGADVDDGAPSFCEVGEGRLDEEKGGAGIDGNNLVEEVCVGGIDIAGGNVGGIVDQAVEGTEGAERGLDEAPGGGRIGEVVDMNGGAFAERIGNGLGERLFESVDEDIGAFGVATTGDCFADAHRAAGDNDGFVRQLHQLIGSLVLRLRDWPGPGQVDAGMRRDLAMAPECMVSKAVCHSSRGQVPPMTGLTSRVPEVRSWRTRSQTVQ